MTIVTITSDWSFDDYYTGVLKGALLSVSQEVNVVEISKNIPSHDVLKEAFVLSSAYKYFPLGTIHLMCVASEPAPNSKMIIAYYDGHYFVGINDGRFSHIFENIPVMGFEIILEDKFSTFQSYRYFATAIDIILNNKFEESTRPCDIKQEIVRRVVYDMNSITGRVVWCDSFGNAITNIERSLFDKLRAGREFTIYAGGPYIKINEICRWYNDYPAGSIIALFNSQGLLELALVSGNLSKIDNIDTSTEVRIKFK